jgi:hypothetical protein
MINATFFYLTLILKTMLFRVFIERGFVILDLGQCQRELKVNFFKIRFKYSEKRKVNILYSLRQGLYF